MTRDEIASLAAAAVKYDLIGADRLMEMVLDDETYEVLDKLINGIGPRWLPAVIVEFLNKIHPVLKVVGILHDVAFLLGTGTRADFRNANDAFSRNGHIVANAKFKWYDPRRYIVRRQATRMAILCHAFGWSAYLNAIEEFKEHMERRRSHAN